MVNHGVGGLVALRSAPDSLLMWVPLQHPENRDELMHADSTRGELHDGWYLC